MVRNGRVWTSTMVKSARREDATARANTQPNASHVISSARRVNQHTECSASPQPCDERAHTRLAIEMCLPPYAIHDLLVNDRLPPIPHRTDPYRRYAR